MVIRRQTTKQTKLPRGKGLSRPQRKQAQRDTGKLCAWVKWQEGLEVLPTINEALAGKYMLYFTK